MGQTISRRKQKERKEPLLDQMKTVAQPSPPPVKRSPSPPPRSLQNTLESNSLTQEFKNFLDILDKNSAGGLDDSGLGEGPGDRVLSLHFVLDVRKLQKIEDDREKLPEINEIGRTYFPCGQNGGGLVLDNNQLWTRCSESCLSGVVNCAVLSNLSLAHDSLLPELDELHLLFLHQREEQSCVKQIINCLL